jgi:hypothetical protein
MDRTPFLCKIFISSRSPVPEGTRFTPRPPQKNYRQDLKRAKLWPILREQSDNQGNWSVREFCLLWLNLFADLLRLFLDPEARSWAENLFLRKQLGFYQERGINPAGSRIQRA